MSTTLCWQCSKPYATGDAECPHCGAANGNADLARASDQCARLDCLPVPADRNQGWPGIYAVLYTDEINGDQTCRDDLWIATTSAIKAAIDKAQIEAYAEGRKDEREALSAPTAEMIEAGKDERMECLKLPQSPPISVGEALTRIYKAMLGVAQ
jgi:hypothetical protein